MNKQVLLIDDDEDEQSLFAEAINVARISAKCIFASSAEAGIKILDNLLPDYIFLDINMPGMNGLECLTEIKKKKSLEKTPVIMYSTSITEAVTHAALALGAETCIQKNDSIKTFAETLKDILIPGSNALY